MTIAEDFESLQYNAEQIEIDGEKCEAEWHGSPGTQGEKYLEGKLLHSCPPHACLTYFQYTVKHSSFDSSFKSTAAVSSQQAHQNANEMMLSIKQVYGSGGSRDASRVENKQ